MRFKSASLLALLTLGTPALAQNYNVQTAPPSWGAPTARQSAPVQDDQIQVDMSAPATANPQLRPASQMASNSVRLQSAVSCAAALQIAVLAAPNWSSEHGVAEATNLWLERVFTEADNANVSGDRVNNLVKEEMEKQTSASIADPNLISRKAFDCATNFPA